jgi:uncharacterized protein YjeT (DUF2065 family)
MEIRLVVRSIGIIVALIAVGYMLKPLMAKRFIGLVQKGSRIYIDGAINLALATVLLIGAWDCRNSWIIFICGLIFLVEGLLIFGLGPEKTRPLLEWSLQQSEELFQFLGLLIGILGVAIIFSV